MNEGYHPDIPATGANLGGGMEMSVPAPGELNVGPIPTNWEMLELAQRVFQQLGVSEVLVATIQTATYKAVASKAFGDQMLRIRVDVTPD